MVIQDPTLLHQVDVFAGLEPSGFVLINTSRSPAALGLGDLLLRMPADHCITVRASELARAHLGRPLPGAPLLGALAGATGIVSGDSLTAAIRERFPGRVGDANAAAPRAVVVEKAMLRA